MEKSLGFVAAVAFSCAGLPSAFGQIQLLNSNTRPVQLVNQSSEDNSPGFADAELSDIPNPFNLFGTDAPQPAQSEGLMLAPNNDSFPANRPTATETSPSDSDPAALPVYTQGRGVVETIQDQALIASVPHASFASVQWPGAVQTPNPVAQILLRDECNASALWTGYPVQRAAECAHMWQHINRRQQHGACGSGQCGAGQCGQCGHAGCGGGCGHGHVRNRYLAPAPASCAAGACAPTGCVGGCDMVPGASLPPTGYPLVPAPAYPLVPTPAHPLAPTEASSSESVESAAGTGDGRFASLPAPAPKR